MSLKIQMLNPQAFAPMFNSVEIVWANVPYSSRILGFAIPFLIPPGNTFSGKYQVKGRYNLGNISLGRIYIGIVILEGFKFQNEGSDVDSWGLAFLNNPFPLPNGFGVISLDLDIDSKISQNQVLNLDESSLSDAWIYVEVSK